MPEYSFWRFILTLWDFYQALPFKKKKKKEKAFLARTFIGGVCV